MTNRKIDLRRPEPDEPDLSKAARFVGTCAGIALLGLVLLLCVWAGLEVWQQVVVSYRETVG